MRINLSHVKKKFTVELIKWFLHGNYIKDYVKKLKVLFNTKEQLLQEVNYADIGWNIKHSKTPNSVEL